MLSLNCHHEKSTVFVNQRQCFSLSKKQYSIFMLRAAARIQSNLLCKFINSGSMVQTTLSCRYAAIHLVYLGIYTREEKMCPQDAVFLRDSLESVVSSERLFGKRSFSTASGTMSFSLCLLGLCNFCLADNHTDQRIKFIIVRGRLSGGSIPALSITLSIQAILRPSFSMTSTPSISCTASPLSAPCTAFQ